MRRFNGFIKGRVLDAIDIEPEGDRSVSIFKVPRMLLAVQESAFLPEIFSFGLFYKERRHMYTDFNTRHLLKRIFGDINGSKTDQDIESSSQSRNRVGPNLDDKVLEDMINLVEKANECYDGLRGMQVDDTFMLMVGGGCFIVERLRSYNKSLTDDDEIKQRHACDGSRDYPIVGARWQLPSLGRDLIKLQNQLPLFFLEELYSMTKSGNDEPSLRDIILTFFRSMFSLDESIYELDPDRKDYAHPLDLFLSLFIFSRKKEQIGNEDHKICINKPKLICWPNKKTKLGDGQKKEKRKFIYSAQDLQEAGVALKRREDSTLLDIIFDHKKRVLWIPPLSIDENMTVALLNFVAYEQCDQSKKPYFTNYLLFLDSLINSTRDVEILRRKRIIYYTLGREKEVVDFFNNFGKGMLYSFDQNCLKVDMDAINSYCNAFYASSRRFWWSNLKRERFSSPWTCLSLVAAVVLLILTMLQTFFTVFPYYHPN